jgi:hypothetical protein
VGSTHDHRANGKGWSVSEPETFEVATKCLEAWSSGDYATARTLLRDDVTFVGPLGSGGGVESYMNSLVDLSRHVASAEPIKVVVDGDDACIIYDLVTDAGGPCRHQTGITYRTGRSPR